MDEFLSEFAFGNDPIPLDSDFLLSDLFQEQAPDIFKSAEEATPQKDDAVDTTSTDEKTPASSSTVQCENPPPRNEREKTPDYSTHETAAHEDENVSR